MKDEDKTKVELIKELKTTQKEREKGVFKNIAEHKEAEEELKESEKKYQRLFENMMDGLVLYKLITDKNGHPVDYIIEEVNKAAEKLQSWNRKDIEGKKATEVYHGDTPFIERYAKVVQTGKAKYFTDYNPRLKKWYKITSFCPEKGYFANISRDITTLKESKETYHTVFENTGTATMVIEEDMTISMVNTQYKKLSGYSKKEIENKMKWTDFIIPEDLEMIKKYHITRRKTKGNPPTEYEFGFIDRKGNIKDIFIKIGIIPNTKKSIASLTDITKRKQIEKSLQEAHVQLEDRVAQRTKELENANLKLQELDRLKSMFIASMNHELRTPLNSIIGFTGIILQGMSGEINDEQKKQLTLVKNSANHLLALINDVIDISKIEVNKVELYIQEFDLTSLAREVKNSFAINTSKKKLKLSLEAPPTLIIKSDERRTKQILVNFISNAVKFTDRGEIEIKIVKKDETVEIAVRDTGIGIRKEDMDKLFESFSQINIPDKTKEGAGLGLYLSRRIAYLLGGDIKVESEFGKGSVFTLVLPCKVNKNKVIRKRN